MKNPTQHLIAEVSRRSSKVGMTIGIDLGDVWSHYCTLNEEGEVVGWGWIRIQSIGSREVVYRSASGADRDGSGHALDLDQRAASGTGSRSDVNNLLIETRLWGAGWNLDRVRQEDHRSATPTSAFAKE